MPCRVLCKSQQKNKAAGVRSEVLLSTRSGRREKRATKSTANGEEEALVTQDQKKSHLPLTQLF
jgi:hypothetical protein